MIVTYLTDTCNIIYMDEFLVIMQFNKPNTGIRASLAFESLFSHFPIKDTIYIVL